MPPWDDRRLVLLGISEAVSVLFGLSLFASFLSFPLWSVVVKEGPLRSPFHPLVFPSPGHGGEEGNHLPVDLFQTRFDASQGEEAVFCAFHRYEFHRDACGIKRFVASFTMRM